MLRNSFCHLPGVAEKTERSLWSAGVVSWDCAVPKGSVRLPRSLLESWERHMAESARHLEQRDVHHFADTLPSNQHWRLFRDFSDRCAFLDIETTGLFFPSMITTIVLYDGRSVRSYVNGKNLDDFVRDVQDYLLLVTYNGKLFDVPTIEAHFGIKLTQAHIDLRHPLHSLGLKGGLKACERKVGIARPGLEDVDGFFAVLLWDDYRKRGNTKALETLLAYNVSDTVSLHALMVHAHNEKLKATPFAASHALPPPTLPALPFHPDRETVERIRSQALREGWMTFRC